MNNLPVFVCRVVCHKFLKHGKYVKGELYYCVKEKDRFRDFIRQPTPLTQNITDKKSSLVIMIFEINLYMAICLIKRERLLEIKHREVPSNIKLW